MYSLPFSHDCVNLKHNCPHNYWYLLPGGNFNLDKVKDLRSTTSSYQIFEVLVCILSYPSPYEDVHMLKFPAGPLLRFYFSSFFAPFFLWLWAGWYTLHCISKRESFIIFLTYIYIGSICSCFACTPVYQNLIGLWPTAAILNCICIHQITFYHWNIPVEIYQRT